MTLEVCQTKRAIPCGCVLRHKCSGTPNSKTCSAAYCGPSPVLAISSPAVRVLISPFRNSTPPVSASKTPECVTTAMHCSGRCRMCFRSSSILLWKISACHSIAVSYLDHGQVLKLVTSTATLR